MPDEHSPEYRRLMAMADFASAHLYHRGAHASPTHHVGPCDEACRHGSRIHAHRARRGRG